MNDNEFRRRLVQALEAFVAVEQAELARHRKQDAKLEKMTSEMVKMATDMLKPKQPPWPPSPQYRHLKKVDRKL